MEARLILLVLMAFVTPGMVWGNTWPGCGASQLCVTSPSGCNPQNQSVCLSASVTNVSMSNTTSLFFNLVGHSSGYITLMLSEPSMNTSTNFTCGQTASNSFYFSSPLTNQTTVNSQGSVNGDLINCTFNFNSISSIFNTSDLDLLNVSLSSFPPSPTTTTPTTTPTTAASNSTVNGTAASNSTVNGTAASNSTVNGTAASNSTVNGTAASNSTVNGTAASNSTVNGTAATNTTTTATTTTTLKPSTTKPTGASVALHPYASLLLLSLVSLSILQKV